MSLASEGETMRLAGRVYSIVKGWRISWPQ